MSGSAKTDYLDDSAIAIIGMAGRFPGARNIDEFWRNLRNGVESISFFSDQELLAWGVDAALLRDPQYVKAGAMLDDVESFDAPFFEFTSREAEITDPQHRLFLECAWTALENAGYDPERFPGLIGVYAGARMNTYLLFNLGAHPDLLEIVGGHQTLIGNGNDFLATRVAFKLNLRGPALSIQTACSTSLVAVHLGCQSLLSRECDMALAGGISINVPKAGYLHQKGGILSPDGHCRAFDARAQGTLFGNGMGVVVLKRLEDALSDGDTIHAIIKGSAINNDGALKVGYTAPSVRGQAEVIAEALSNAGVDAETIAYVETHGTGTDLGDPIEIEALTQAFRTDTSRIGFCAIGAVKTNVGHLDAAAGVVGLIKTILALKHRQIPPSLHFQQPNPKIDFAHSPFYVNTALTDWKATNTPRRAGVSAFGFGGTNAHLVLEEAPPLEPSGDSHPWQMLPLSAKTASALDAASANLATHLRQHPDLHLADVAYTLQVGRRAFSHRRVAVCQSVNDAATALETLDAQRVLTSVATATSSSVAFMFPGQGAQHVQMAADLYRSEPFFRAEVDRCCALFEPHLKLDLRSVIYPNENDTESAARQLNRIDITLPALFAIEYPLARLWQAWGVRPQAMIGYSHGEYVAACLAGVFSLEDAVMLVATRGRLMHELPGGAMLAVSLPEEQVRSLLNEHLDLAAVNGPDRCVVSGLSEAVDDLARRLAEQKTTFRRLNVSHAFHSAMMAPMVESFTEQVKKIRLSPPQIPFLSNVTGTWATAAEVTDPRYWARHLRQPVRFADGVRELLREPERVLLEVGPEQLLCAWARRHPDRSDRRPVLASMRRSGDRQSDTASLLQAVGQLWMHGVEIDWEAFYADERRKRLPLPTYPFERQRYWIEPGKRPATRSLSRTPNIDEWFYLPSWKRTPPVAPSLPDATVWLVFSDGGRLSDKLIDRLADRSGAVIIVRAGEQFTASEGSYTVRPAQREDYEALLAELHRHDLTPAHIVHLWNVALPEANTDTSDRTLDASFYSLLCLAQSLGKQDTQDGVDWVVVSSGLHRVTEEDRVQPERATLLGPCRVIPREMPHVTCRSIDVAPPEAGSRQEDRLVEQLVAELSTPGADSIVAYRGRDRWAQAWEPVALRKVEETPHPRLREGGVYLIAGGLGGIGLTLAEYLARAVRAKLVLTSRSRFAEPASDDRASQRIQAVQTLEAAGAEVMVMQADVTDRAQMAEAVRVARQRFGALNGVIHAAGVLGGGLIALRTPASAAAVLAPKVQGTRVLEAVLRDTPLDFLMLCSSTTAVVGSAGRVDYCAANAFLDAFAQAQDGSDGTPIIAIDWERWAQVGMAANAPLSAATHRAETALRHPILKSVYQEGPTRSVYSMTLNPAEHWPLSEHVAMGIPLLPGATHIELAAAAWTARTSERTLEIREALFPIPLMVREGDRQEARLILEEDEDEFHFQVASKTETSAGGEMHWRTHAIGHIRRLPDATPQHYDIEAIRARCNVLRRTGDARAESSARRVLKVGPRWATSLKQADFGRDEAVALLELAPAFASDLEGCRLHPALLDIATSFASAMGGDYPYLPLSYEHMRVYDNLPGRFFSYVRFKPGNEPGSEMLALQVTFIDEQGRGFVEIETFTMKRANEAAVARLRDSLENAPRSASQDSLAHALSPEEGVEVFQRVLACNHLPQVVVCTRHLPTLLERVDELTQARLGQEAARTATWQQGHPRPHLSSLYVAPRNEIEKELATLWQQQLGLIEVGVQDSFFELGGDSLIATQLISKARTTFEVELNIARFFETPTIAALAEAIAEGQLGNAIDEQALVAAVSEVEGLSQEELRAALAEGVSSNFDGQA